MTAPREPLPVDELEVPVVASLEKHPFLVLSAPTGSGKSTRVPQFLHRWTSRSAGEQGGMIYVLEPRVLAARLLAERVADEMGCDLGEEVGYLTRHERRLSSRTRVCFVTEGLFFRILREKPDLPGVSAVVIDEFHERSLDGDLVLGLLREKRLRGGSIPPCVVMSATLDAGGVAAYLGCPALSSAGRTFPVEIEYAGSPDHLAPPPPWELAVAGLRRVFSRKWAGDGLVFMPGMHEIRRTVRAIEEASFGEPLDVRILHGELESRDQHAALARSGRRRVIVSTNVAETSLTVPGVTWVVDCGLARVARYDASRGLDVLAIERIAKASADQRAGRAGRTAPGLCIRLWGKGQHERLPDRADPEIRRVDLTDTALRLKSLGHLSPGAFDWITPAEAGSWEKAEGILRLLGAVDETGELTEEGERMAASPLSARLSRLSTEAGRRGVLDESLLWAAIAGETDPRLRGRYETDRKSAWRSDFSELAARLRRAARESYHPAACDKMGLHGQNARRVMKAWEQFRRQAGRGEAGVGEESANASEVDLIKCLLAAFPDRLAAKEHAATSFATMVGGRTGHVADTSVARAAPLFLAAEVIEIPDRREKKTTFDLASAVEADWIREIHPRALRKSERYFWNPRDRQVDAEEVLLFLDLSVEKRPLATLSPERIEEALVAAHAAGEFKLTHWNEKVESWIARVRFTARVFPERRLPVYDPSDLEVILREVFSGGRRARDVTDRDCLTPVKFALGYDDQVFVEKMAPERLTLSNGFELSLRYEDPARPPVASARIQKLYDASGHPEVAGGREKVLLDLLAPNQRTVQKTLDLPGFWTGSYPAIRKDLAGRYPKHEWR